jgi:alkanesulfonate monooxygenase SsuD/methylene tetrahydromethanopterin reductase-like flavin-dependent oxidoreductase (luciferase family)
VQTIKAEAASHGREIDVYAIGVVTCRPTQRDAEAYYRHAIVEHADWSAVDLVLAKKDISSAIHRFSMPMILRTEQEIETWMTAPAEEALTLQRPVPDGSLRVIGAKEDGPVEQLGSADRPQALPK